MPSIEHIAILVGVGATRHPQLREVVDLTSKRVVEEYAHTELVDVEGVLQTTVDDRVGRTEVYEVIFVQSTIVVGVDIVCITRLVGVRCTRYIGLGLLLAYLAQCGWNMLMMTHIY